MTPQFSMYRCPKSLSVVLGSDNFRSINATYLQKASPECLLKFLLYLVILWILNNYILKNFISFREREREGERKGEKHWCVGKTSMCCLLQFPNQGSRHVSWPGIKPETFGLRHNVQPTKPQQSGRILNHFILFYFILKRFYLLLHEGEGREKERERNIHVWLPLACPPPGNLVFNPGMCPDWESNRWPFGSHAGTQSTEPHQPWWILNNFKFQIFSPPYWGC